MGGRVYDAIVVGGGPAGAMAAYHLAAAGWEVAVVDACTFPRRKTCGGGLTVRAARLLPFPVDEVVEDRSSAFRFSLRGAEPVLARAPEPFVLQVRRERFDHLLLRQAAQQGARLLLGRPVAAVRERDDLVEVVLRPAGDEGPQVLAARVVVGADGARGVTARSVGLGRGQRRLPAVEADVPVPSHPAGVLSFDFDLPQGGYGWVFPKRGSASVGVIAFRRPRAPLRGELDRYAALWGLAPLGRACEGAPLGCDGRVRRPATRRVALVGDAAGLADPFSGEGIYYALRSALLLAETLARANPRRPDLGRYARRLAAELGPELAWAARVAAAFYRAPARFYGAIRSRPGYADAVVRLCLGELGMPQLARALARLTLGLPPRTRPRVELEPCGPLTG